MPIQIVQALPSKEKAIRATRCFLLVPSKDDFEGKRLAGFAAAIAPRADKLKQRILTIRQRRSSSIRND
jgi:hypothetical protein